jgi:hypothetical protein
MKSDCLVTGVMPVGVESEAKRANTVFVRPWMPDGVESLMGVVPGTRVGLIPSDDMLVETNPRDLTWDEFMKVHIHVGKVCSVHRPIQKNLNATLQEVRLLLDFGDKIGKKPGVLWLRAPFLDADQLLGRQILAVTNLAIELGSEPANWFEDGAAAVLTVNGKAVLEPAKTVDLGYYLA